MSGCEQDQCEISDNNFDVEKYDPQIISVSFLWLDEYLSQTIDPVRTSLSPVRPSISDTTLSQCLHSENKFQTSVVHFYNLHDSISRWPGSKEQIYQLLLPMEYLFQTANSPTTSVSIPGTFCEIDKQTCLVCNDITDGWWRVVCDGRLSRLFDAEHDEGGGLISSPFGRRLAWPLALEVELSYRQDYDRYVAVHN